MLRLVAMSTVSVFRNFFNSLLTLCFVQLFSGKSSVNPFAVYLFQYKLFIKILFSSLNTMLSVNKHCNDICCDEFLVPQIDHNSKQKKNSVMENFICNRYGERLHILNTENIKICLCFLSYLLNICKKMTFFISQCSAVTMPKVRWIFSHVFCSKFHKLSSSAKIFKIGHREFKGGNFF